MLRLFFRSRNPKPSDGPDVMLQRPVLRRGASDGRKAVGLTCESDESDGLRIGNPARECRADYSHVGTRLRPVGDYTCEEVRCRVRLRDLPRSPACLANKARRSPSRSVPRTLFPLLPPGRAGQAVAGADAQLAGRNRPQDAGQQPRPGRQAGHRADRPLRKGPVSARRPHARR